MSTGIKLVTYVDVGGQESHKVTIWQAPSDITANLSDMAREAGIYEEIYDSSGERAGGLIKNLKLGVGLREQNPGRFDKLNPANGWGCRKHLLQFSKGLLEACERFPLTLVGLF